MEDSNNKSETDDYNYDTKETFIVLRVKNSPEDRSQDEHDLRFKNAI